MAHDCSSPKPHLLATSHNFSSFPAERDHGCDLAPGPNRNTARSGEVTEDAMVLQEQYSTEEQDIRAREGIVDIVGPEGQFSPEEQNIRADLIGVVDLDRHRPSLTPTWAACVPEGQISGLETSEHHVAQEEWRHCETAVAVDGQSNVIFGGLSEALDSNAQSRVCTESTLTITSPSTYDDRQDFIKGSPIPEPPELPEPWPILDSESQFDFSKFFDSSLQPLSLLPDRGLDQHLTFSGDRFSNSARPRETSGPTFCCLEPGCKKSFTRKCDMEKHMRRVHDPNKRKHRCEECSMGFTYPKDLRRHMSKHRSQASIDVNQFHCNAPDCNYTSSRKDHLKRHWKLVHHVDSGSVAAEPNLTNVHDPGRSTSGIGYDSTAVVKCTKKLDEATTISIEENNNFVAWGKHYDDALMDTLPSDLPSGPWGVGTSFKHTLPFDDQFDPKRRREERSGRRCEQSVMQGHALTAFEKEYADELQDFVDVPFREPFLIDPNLRGSPLRLEALNSLDFERMYDRYEAIGPAHAATCQWIFENNVYKDWLGMTERSDSNGFLWIKGKPGAGKSTLLKYASEHARKSLTDRTVVSFFFNLRGEDLERSTQGMYRSLLSQIFRNIPGVQQVLDKQRQRKEWPSDVLVDLLREVVMSLGQRRLLCYIDALDECGEAEVRSMIEAFERLMVSASEGHADFRVCFSSRHYPHISMNTYREIVLEDQDGHKSDIAAYVQKTLKVSAGSRLDIAKEIRQRASSLFLWVALVVRILNEDHDRGYAHKIESRLEEVPDGVDKMIQDTMVRGTPDTYLVPTLQWIIFANRPLSCEELYQAVVSPSSGNIGTAIDIGGLEPGETAKRFILNSSKGLAESTKSEQPIVRFIHEAVGGYLRDTGLGALVPDLGQDPETWSHEYLMQRCLHFISDHVLQALSLPNPPPGAKSKEARDLRRRSSMLFPFLQYAVENVIFHAERACVGSLAKKETLQAFPLSTWITLHNILQTDEVHQYTSSATKTYILAAKGAPQLLDIELQLHAEFPTMEENHRTLLGAAVYTHGTETVATIIRHGGLSSYSLKEQKRCLEVALDAGAWGAAELIIKANACVVSLEGSEHTLVLCSRKGNLRAVELLLGQFSEPDSQGNVRNSALMAACANGFGEIAATLLDKGADVNAHGFDYGTALQAASEQGHKELVEILLKAGANVPRNGGQYGTALQAASSQGHEEIVEMLLKADVTNNAGGGCHGRALHAALLGGHTRVAQLLFKEGADIKTEGECLRKPLQGASYGGQDAVARTKYIPVARNAKFTGRKCELEMLEQKLFLERDCKKVAVVGIGGIGKTQVALRFADTMFEEHCDVSVFWMSALSTEAFEQGFREIARVLGFPVTSDREGDAKGMVQRYLSTAKAGKWLLIVDNIDNMGVLREGGQGEGILRHLPESESGVTVFTTRNSNIAQALVRSDVIELSKMTETEAFGVLCQSLWCEDLLAREKATITRLLVELDYLPLAITQAAAYVNCNKHISLREYLDLLQSTEENTIRILSAGMGDSTPFEKAMNATAKTWLLSFEQVLQQEPDAADLLLYASCIEWKAIPQSIHPSLQPTERTLRAISTLCSYSFIKRRNDGETYDMHHLVHVAVRAWLGRDASFEETQTGGPLYLCNVLPSEG